MKATELIIGDLVRVNRDELCIKKDTIVEVRAVDADDTLKGKGLIGSAHCRPLDDGQFDGGIWCEYLDPLLLTPEILKKNGFGYIKKDEVFMLTHYYLGTSRYCKDMDLHIGTNNLGDYWINDRRNSLFGLHYVHELQHVLRLWRIEKEIVL